MAKYLFSCMSASVSPGCRYLLVLDPCAAETNQYSEYEMIVTAAIGHKRLHIQRFAGEPRQTSDIADR